MVNDMLARHKPPDGWIAEPVVAEVWREKFYIQGCCWTPPRTYEYDDDHPVSVHYEVYKCWRLDDGSLRFYPCNDNGAKGPQDDFQYIGMSVKWDGCSDVNFGDDFAHFCSATEAFETGALLAHLYEISRGLFDPASEEDFMVKDA